MKSEKSNVSFARRLLRGPGSFARKLAAIGNLISTQLFTKDRTTRKEIDWNRYGYYGQDKTVALTCRINAELKEAIDKFIEDNWSHFPRWDRSTIIRVALHEFLEKRQNDKAKNT